uniref:Ripening regulated protein DDTFR10 n=1 Tax=Solanum tuberosum TaxID=4113 RepID=M1CPJ9_SOLTU
MVVAFDNLNSYFGLKKLDEFLLAHSYITGYQASKDDIIKLEEYFQTVQLEGLTFGASKLVPAGYAIKKLQIMLTIVDDLVSMDDLLENYLTVEPINEYVQSCDILAFNKV